MKNVMKHVKSVKLWNLKLLNQLNDSVKCTRTLIIAGILNYFNMGLLFIEMTDWNWHLIVSLPSNQETVSSDIDVLFFYFYFQNKAKIMVSLKKEKPSEKSYIVEEELDCADRYRGFT